MKAKILYILSFLLIMGFMISCDTTPEAIEIQTPKTHYAEQYYQDLREYKASDHSVCFVWFSDYTRSLSMANRFAGLPDSIDVVSLWGGIPKEEINPLAYTEMRFMQKVLGTKMVIPTIVRIEDGTNGKNELEYYKMFQESYVAPITQEKLDMRNKAMEMYADRLLKDMWDNDLDGLDLDYEPEGDRLTGDNFDYFVAYIGGFIGPMSPRPDKLLIIDFYGHYPTANTEPYANYFIRQAYTQGFTEHSASRLQGYYRDWMPTRKFIVTENIGDHWRTGGSPFTEADGNKLNSKGEPLYSLEGMARWNPTQGQKGGFGAFFCQRDYSSNPPYKHLRNGIQAQNPSIK